MPEILLSREEDNPLKQENDGRILLIHAKNGYEGAVKILLEPEQVNPCLADNCCKPRSCVLRQESHTGVVKMLRRWEGINPNKADTHCQAQPILAAINERKSVITLMQFTKR